MREGKLLLTIVSAFQNFKSNDIKGPFDSFLRCIIETCLELLLAVGTPESWLLPVTPHEQLRSFWEEKMRRKKREVQEEGCRKGVHHTRGWKTD